MDVNGFNFSCGLVSLFCCLGERKPGQTKAVKPPTLDTPAAYLIVVEIDLLAVVEVRNSLTGHGN